MTRMRLWSAAAVLAAVGSLPTATARAQDMPKTEYYRFVPLEVPRLVRQTQASAALHLYGNPRDAAYVDVAPRDGIDDRRFAVLQGIAVRFAPFMVLNTTSVPMDFKFFQRGRDVYNLTVDYWNTVGEGGTLAREETINLIGTAARPCTALERLGGSGRDDCRLLDLLEYYDPDNPASAVERARAIEPTEDLFQVLYIDFPGHDEASWKAEYEDKATGQLPLRYRAALKTYVHPFLQEVQTPAGERGLELVVQYWFFYPWNDGGNNHKGDWEHVNVVVSPLKSVTRLLTPDEMQRVLDGSGLGADSGGEQLVIKRIEYYFHHQVLSLDYTSPNVYLPRDEWEQQQRQRFKERIAENWFWDRIRWRAYEDEAETRINTHPVVHIGADNKGFDQILAAPGGKNRDSHGSFPFPGLYKDVGPGGAAEEITTFFDHQEFFAATAEKQAALLNRWERGGVVRLSAPETVELLPDWERVIDLVRTDPVAREQWGWLVLPIRFGYPASASPFAGIVAHAETGNLAILGPAFSTGWNRAGASAGFHDYAPHKIPRLFPLGVQDGFRNSWGFFNIFAAATVLPPLDFVWRILAAPVRALTGRQDPTFYPQENLPYRFFGVTGGVALMKIPTDFQDLAINNEQFDDIVVSLLEFLLERGDTTTAAVNEEEFTDDVVAPFAAATFFIGDRFVSENMVRHSRSRMGVAIDWSNITEQYVLSSELNLWEWAGSLRYNLSTGNLMVYPKAGYGLSWYRLENISGNGTPIPQPNSKWITKWTWHGGAGMELVLLKSYRPPPTGIDLSLRGEWTAYSHNLGLELGDLPLETLVLLGRGANDLPRDRRVTRHEFRLGLTLSF